MASIINNIVVDYMWFYFFYQYTFTGVRNTLGRAKKETLGYLFMTSEDYKFKHLNDIDKSENSLVDKVKTN